jgi:spermidine synthase
MEMLKRMLLPAAVFLTGASVLIVEVVGLRVLSPFYGNTIFTVSSVVSVILLALGCGYYVGGKLADRNATLRRFFGLIFVSGVVLLLFYAIGTVVLPALSARLSISSGPLVSALLLFFPGAFLLGTLSPHAVKLQSMRLGEGGVGSATGSIFFWSTLGSISGSLSAGFVLIPHFGVDRILIANGSILSLVGLVYLLLFGLGKNGVCGAALVFALAAGAAALAARHVHRDVLYVRDGVYQKISIYDAQYDGRPTRFFQQDQNSAGAGEGAMFLDSDDPADLVYDYTKYYLLYKIFTPHVANALVIGGGAYSVPKALLRELPQAIVDVVDIEPSLLSLGKAYFKVPDSLRLHNHVEDGRRFLSDSGKKYDLIFSDVYYSFFSVPPHFATKEFFTIARNKLSPNGIFVANMIGNLSRRQESLVMSAIKTFQIAFPNNYVFAVSWPERTDPQNIMLVGYNSSERIDLNTPSILRNRDPLIRSLPLQQVDVDARFDFSQYPVLTDNFAPVEFLTSRVLQRSFESQKTIDGDEMLADVAQQERYGNRQPGASGHDRTAKFLSAEMKLLAQDVEFQTWKAPGSDGRTYDQTNVVAHFYSSVKPRVLLATNTADASDVAILVELARGFGDSNVPPKFGVDLVFFDGSEAATQAKEGAIDGASAGSAYFAQHWRDLYGDDKPAAAIILDAVCRKDLRVLKEQSSMQSNSAQVDEFWSAAQHVSHNVFLDSIGPQIEGDQMPLIEGGIPSVLIADSRDQQSRAGKNTPGDCTAQSLEAVGQALMNYAMPRETSSDR